MKKCKNISGIYEIIDFYDVYILDQWGVMHDGNQGYENAKKCIKELYKRKKTLIIISNSSKRKEATIKRLPKLGFNSNYFREVMTSGEMIWQSLKKKNYSFVKKLKKNCYHLYDHSHKGAKKFVDGLDSFNFVDKIEDADFILGCTPFNSYQTIDYLPILIEAKNKNMPFVCANPDYETIENKSNNLSICMGTIAQLYENLGGEVFILGKPSVEIYSESIKKLKKLSKKRILAVGDSIYHDIKGADLFNIDSLLITSGIHKSSFDKNKPIWESTTNKIKNLGIYPTFLCTELRL